MHTRVRAREYPPVKNLLLERPTSIIIYCGRLFEKYESRNTMKRCIEGEDCLEQMPWLRDAFYAA